MVFDDLASRIQSWLQDCPEDTHGKGRVKKCVKNKCIYQEKVWLDCKNDKTCDTISGKNQYQCVKGKCKERVCYKEGDCPLNLYCVENKCKPDKPCKKHKDCDGDDFCRKGKCENSCEKDLVRLNSWILIRTWF